MRVSYLLLPIVLLFSCKTMMKDKPPVPAGKMEAIFLDLHIAEAYSSMLDDSLHQSRNKNLDSLAVYYTDVFSHHDITKEQFLEGVNWYKKHPEEMDSFYRGVITEAGKLESIYVK